MPSVFEAVSKICGDLAIVVSGCNFALGGARNHMFDKFALRVQWSIGFWIVLRFVRIVQFVTEIEVTR